MSNVGPQALYIHPAKQQVGFPFTDPRFSYLTPFTLLPMGVIGLANRLRQEGIAIQGLNYPAESFIQPGFDLADWLRHAGTVRLILIDLHWYEHSFGALDVARVCKQLLPHTPIVVGGLTASLYAREILDAFPWVDYIIRGDAEEPLSRIVSAFCSGSVQHQDLEDIPNLTYRWDNEVLENTIIYHTSVQEYNSLNLCDLDFLSHADTYLGFQYVGRKERFFPDEPPRQRAHWLNIGRGCVYDCSFCGGGHHSHEIISGRQSIMLRSPERVADDIEVLRARGIDQVSLSHDPAILGEAYWKALLGELSRRRVRIGFYYEAFQLPGEDFIEAFAECADLQHSQIALSLLSGDENVRRLNGKQYSNHELFDTLKTLRRHRLPLAIYYSFNLPGQDEGALRKTLFVTQRLEHLYPRPLLMVYNQPHTLDPCSPMGRHPEDFGIKIEYRSFQDYFDYCRLTAVEKPGVQGRAYRGFTWRGRAPEVEAKMQAMWLAFARSQSFLCF